MRLSVISFTDRGEALAERLSSQLGIKAVRCTKTVKLADWTRERFADSEGLIFVGAAGIAVRAIAPFVRSKASDPAVVVVDEAGKYAIPILSGHLGGANDLARRIAAILGAQAVITTATDLRGLFAVDEWARTQGCVIPEPAGIKTVSARLLRGGTVSLWSEWPVKGKRPEEIVLAGDPAGADIVVSVRKGASADALAVVPKILSVGIGCRKGIGEGQIEAFFQSRMRELGYREEAVAGVCSIDLKKDEKGLISFCERHGFPLTVFSASQLAKAHGTFSSSDYVRRVTGVDNVCERSAVLGSGGGDLTGQKEAREGVTLAFAMASFSPVWDSDTGGSAV